MTLLSIGDQIEPGTYRFHSRFNRVVNFERRGRLIAVVDETIGPGPLNIVLRGLRAAPGEGRARLSSARRQMPQGGGRLPLQVRHKTVRFVEANLNLNPALNPNLPLQISPDTVLFAGRRYHFTSRHRYDSTLDLQPVDLRRLQRNLAALGQSLTKAAPAKSLAFLLASTRRKNFRAGFERAFAEQITRAVRHLFHGRLLHGIRHLKGCGPGLTPAGDDFIAGHLIGLRLLEKLHGQDFQPVADAVFRAARGGNIFSNTFLDLARRGLLFGPMKDLLLALVSGSAASVRNAAGTLFRVGDSSGADLATGLFLTLRPSVWRRPKYHESTRCPQYRQTGRGRRPGWPLRPGVPHPRDLSFSP